MRIETVTLSTRKSSYVGVNFRQLSFVISEDSTKVNDTGIDSLIWLNHSLTDTSYKYIHSQMLCSQVM